MDYGPGANAGAGAGASVTILSLADRDAWDAAYLDGGLPSHSWHYAWGLAATGYDPRLALVRSGGAVMILPFHVRGWAGQTDIATLPGLSGALIHPHSGADPAAPLVLWRGHARAQGWVSGYIQLSIRNSGMSAPPGDRIVAHNTLFEFDLSDWDMTRAVSRNTRRSLERADRTGVQLVTDPVLLRAAFRDLYGPAMQMFGAAEVFSQEALERWFTDPDLLLYGAATDGRIVAVDLGRRNGIHAEMHLAALTPEGRTLHSWLVWKLAEDLRRRGLRHVNIGGYLHEGDGVHFMKQRFNTPAWPLRSLRQIYRPDMFAQLCREAGIGPGIDGPPDSDPDSDPVSDPDLQAGRFPPYRFARP